MSSRGTISSSVSTRKTKMSSRGTQNFFKGKLYRLKIAKSDESKAILTKVTKRGLKKSNFHTNGNFVFLTSCHKIKLDELQSTSILAILHFISKLLLLFCSKESFLSNKVVYIWWQVRVKHGNVVSKILSFGRIASL